MSIVNTCGSGSAVPLHLLCHNVATLPSRTLPAAPFSPTVSWLSAVAVHPVRGSTPVGGGVVVVGGSASWSWRRRQRGRRWHCGRRGGRAEHVDLGRAGPRTAVAGLGQRGQPHEARRDRRKARRLLRPAVGPDPGGDRAPPRCAIQGHLDAVLPDRAVAPTRPRQVLQAPTPSSGPSCRSSAHAATDPPCRSTCCATTWRRSPSRTLPAAPFSPTVSWLSAVAVHPVRGSTPVGGGVVVVVGGTACGRCVVAVPSMLISAALVHGPRLPASVSAVNRTKRAETDAKPPSSPSRCWPRSRW